MFLREKNYLCREKNLREKAQENCGGLSILYLLKVDIFTFGVVENLLALLRRGLLRLPRSATTLRTGLRMPLRTLRRMLVGRAATEKEVEDAAYDGAAYSKDQKDYKEQEKEYKAKHSSTQI